MGLRPARVRRGSPRFSRLSHDRGRRRCLCWWFEAVGYSDTLSEDTDGAKRRSPSRNTIWISNSTANVRRSVSKILMRLVRSNRQPSGGREIVDSGPSLLACSLDGIAAEDAAKVACAFVANRGGILHQCFTVPGGRRRTARISLCLDRNMSRGHGKVRGTVIPMLSRPTGRGPFGHGRSTCIRDVIHRQFGEAFRVTGAEPRAQSPVMRAEFAL
jgi:hypothetical protein